jgi:hypothetical protein
MAGHKVWAIGEEVIQSDFQPIVADQVVAVFVTAAARTAGWPGPPPGAVSYLTDAQALQVFNGTSWVQVTPAAATISAPDTRNAGTYGDGAGGPGPAVSILTGARVAVSVSAHLDNGGGTSAVFMGYDVSGATTAAAIDTEAFGFAGPAGFALQASFESQITVTPGLNTFTAKYRAATGTVYFANRKIRVTPLP